MHLTSNACKKPTPAMLDFADSLALQLLDIWVKLSELFPEYADKSEADIHRIIFKAKKRGRPIVTELKASWKDYTKGELFNANGHVLHILNGYKSKWSKAWREDADRKAVQKEEDAQVRLQGKTFEEAGQFLVHSGLSYKVLEYFRPVQLSTGEVLFITRSAPVKLYTRGEANSFLRQCQYSNEALTFEDLFEVMTGIYSGPNLYKPKFKQQVKNERQNS